uniref:Spindle apparatus coiled-coil protein 1 n=1 Tax=Sphenodon punctatus TaxID=8508 RepID=A0A8D0GMK2_SPHPU
MERQLISMKVKYQSLQKQHAFTREQLQRTKLQMATLLQMKGSQAEIEQLERLQSMMEQKNGEIEDLLMKVRQLEKYKNLYENMEELKPSNSSSKGGELEDGYYTDLLQMKLDTSNKEIETLRNELSLQRMKALYESQRVLEVERKLFTNERQLQAFQGENMKFRVKLEELKIKYEPEELIKLPANKKRREKLPLDILSEDLPNKSASMQETTYLLFPNKENARLCTKGAEDQSGASVKNTLVAAPMTVALVPTMQLTEKPERKRVKIQEEHYIQALTERDGKNSLQTPAASRLTSESSQQEGGNEDREIKVMPEKKSRKKPYPMMYVSSKPTPETQCPQQ